MTKPNGYCAWHPEEGWYGIASHTIHKNRERCYENFISPGNMIDWQIKPVCLVPPEVLKWVGKVRQRFQGYVIDEDFDSSASTEKLLLEELEKIWPEKQITEDGE